MRLRRTLLETDTDQGRFADIVDVIERLVTDEAFPIAPIDRLTIHFHASGEATWRARVAETGAEEGGYLSARP